MKWKHAFAEGLGTAADGTPRFVELVQSDVLHQWDIRLRT